MPRSATFAVGSAPQNRRIAWSRQNRKVLRRSGTRRYAGLGGSYSQSSMPDWQAGRRRFDLYSNRPQRLTYLEDATTSRSVRARSPSTNVCSCQ
jgi:hypothetical protein